MGAPTNKIEDSALDAPADFLPTDSEESFRDLIDRVREGSRDAGRELVDRYGGHLRRAVRRLLDRRLRPKFDSLDFVQLVWQSFFRMNDQADRFEGPEHLVKFLAGVARHKVHMEARRRLTGEQCNVEREVSLNHLSAKKREKMIGRDPEPADVAIAQERLDELLKDRPARHRRIIKLKLDEYTSAEIGAILGLDRHTVHRFLNRLSEANDLLTKQTSLRQPGSTDEIDR